MDLSRTPTTASECQHIQMLAMVSNPTVITAALAKTVESIDVSLPSFAEKNSPSCYKSIKFHIRSCLLSSRTTRTD